MTIKAGVLGATGSVGQRFILLLSENPEFELVSLGASERSSGRAYSSITAWKQSAYIPPEVGALTVHSCDPVHFRDCDVVFSGLDSSVAGEIEKAFVVAGLNIISNSKNYRQDPEVPLVVPTANPEHLDALRFRQGSKKGLHVCISNCSTAGIVVPLRALQDKFGSISHVEVTTLQAISGAGFSPGVGGMDIIDNLVPYISGEEDKVEREPRKILGTTENGSFLEIPPEEMKISATCTRVPVVDGHVSSVAVKFANAHPSVEEVKQALAMYKSEAQEFSCQSAPRSAIAVLDAPDRPQPRLDRDIGRGFTVSVGRVREDPVMDIKFVSLSHNTVLGAAGSGILIAELLKAKKLL